MTREEIVAVMREHNEEALLADGFEDAAGVLVVGALPGVPQRAIELALVPGGLIVRAERQLSIPDVRRWVRQLEIPYGRFERRIGLPPGPSWSTIAGILLLGLILRNSGLNWSPTPMSIGCTL